MNDKNKGVTDIPNEWTTLAVLRKTASRLAIIQKQLGFHSANYFIETMLNIVAKKGYSKLDLECLGTYGHIPEIESGTAISKEDLERKLGKPKEFIEKVPVEGKITKKDKS